MDAKLTEYQAFKAMFIFVRTYYEQIGTAVDVGSLLGDIQLVEDGMPADPAMWQDWLEAVNLAVTSNSEESCSSV
jgi:hypothetical protein